MIKVVIKFVDGVQIRGDGHGWIVARRVGGRQLSGLCGWRGGRCRRSLLRWSGHGSVGRIVCVL